MLLMLHSLLRWLVLFGGLAATVLAFQAWKGKPWSPLHKRVNLIFLIAMDTQFLVGMVTWLQSPLVAAARVDMKLTMHDPVMRFFTVEHPAFMLMSLAAMHVGYGIAKKAGVDTAKHRSAFLALAASLVLLTAAIPWI